MKKDLAFVILIVAIIAAAYVGVSYTGLFTAAGTQDELAQCLTQKGVVMYGAYWCPHCANQKAEFGPSFQYINSVECDPNGDNANPQLCQEKGVTGYPTWEINGQMYSGEQSLERLASLAGC